MYNIKHRLHMQNHKEPNGRAFIVGEKAALRAVGEALIKASKSMLGLERLEVYTSDGHRYELLITSEVSEDEWQELPVPYNNKHDLNNLSIVQNVEQFKSTKINQ